MKKKATDEPLYKILDENSCSPYQGFKWPLPSKTKPGRWIGPIDGELEACVNGIHLCRSKDLLRWLGPQIFTAEYSGERVDADNKIVVRKARLLTKISTWNDKTARLFACDCAERALSYVVQPDSRSVTAIEISRKFANGEASSKDLAAARAAARDAAWDAARAATRDAARDAAWDAAEDAAGAAAWDAAWDAAGDAAWAAAWAAAWDAEQEWQTTRLLEYLRGEK